MSDSSSKKGIAAYPTAASLIGTPTTPENPAAGFAVDPITKHTSVSTVPTDPKAFQQYLNSLGVKPPLVVDGVIGPKTLAAAATLKVQVPPNLAPPTPAAPAQPVAPVTPTVPAPGGSTAPAGPAAGAAAAQDPVAVAEDQLRSQFGYGAWVIDNPELMAIINQAAQAQTSGTPWTDAQFQTAVSQTAWWKGNSDSQRAWQNLQNSNPGEATAEIGKMGAQLNQIAQADGITISPERMQDVAADALARGLTTPQQLQQQVANEFRYQPGGQTGALGTAEQSIKQMASDYLTPVSDGVLAQWDQQVAASTNPTSTANDFKQYFVDHAKSMFPALAKQLDAGATVQQLADPYRQIAARELEKSPDEIDFTQPKYMQALSATDPTTGTPTMMGLADWTKKIRSDDSYGWDKTQNGIDAYTQLSSAFLKAAGFQA